MANLKYFLVKDVADKNSKIVIRSTHRFAKGFCAILSLIYWICAGHTLLQSKALVALVMWIIPIVIMIISIIWLLFGLQIVSFSQNNLIIEPKIWSVKFGKIKVFPVFQITGWDINEIYSRRGISAKYSVSFDYLGHKQLVSVLPSKEQAELLLISLHNLIERSIK